jgi:methylation protein EvaC
MKLYENIKNCASCNSGNLIILHDFGSSPLAGYFPKSGEASEQYRIPMQLMKCLDCELVQVSPCVDDDLLFRDYRYLSRFAMSKHFDELSNWIVNRIETTNIKILEIGCNDGTLLDKLRSRGIQVEGVDPAVNVANYAISNGHKIYCDFFSDVFVSERKLANNYDLIISCNSFAHISEIRKVCQGVTLALKENGIFIIEVQAWPELVRLGTFDFVYHEHRYYYDLRSISNLLKQFGLSLIDAEQVDSHGNSYRLTFQKNGNQERSSEVVSREKQLTVQQIKSGVNDFLNAINATSQRLDELSLQKKEIIAFGASGRGNMILAQFSRTDHIKAVFDESPERIGREMALTGIPIRDFRDLDASEYDVCLILAWNHAREIIEKWPHKRKLLLVPLPQLFEKFT